MASSLQTRALHPVCFRLEVRDLDLVLAEALQVRAPVEQALGALGQVVPLEGGLAPVLLGAPLASLLQVAHLASLLQVVAPLASLLQVVLVQPLGLLALQQGVRLERLKRVDSGDSGAALVAAAPLAPSPPLRFLELRPGVRLVPLQPEALVRRGLVPLRLCRSFSPWAQPEALLEDKEKRRPCPRRSSAGRLRWHWT